jgi:hypothetical protein
MNNSNQTNQTSQGCCDSTNESFDCAAMMEQFKSCCEGTKSQDQSNCCAQMLQNCCGTSETESVE